MSSATLTEREVAAGLAAALYHFGTYDSHNVGGIARSLATNYGIQRDRLARIVDGTATEGDITTWPDDSYAERDHEYVSNMLGARRFALVRDIDETGVSGTGRIAEGVVCTHQRAALHWLTEHRSVAFYPSIETVERIHGHGGKTRIIFEEDDTTTATPAAERLRAIGWKPGMSAEAAARLVALAAVQASA
jgi:hypothetical protein